MLYLELHNCILLLLILSFYGGNGKISMQFRIQPYSIPEIEVLVNNKRCKTAFEMMGFEYEHATQNTHTVREFDLCTHINIFAVSI